MIPVPLIFAFLAAAAPAVTVDDSFDPDLRRRLQAIADDVWSVAQQKFQARPPIDVPIVCRRDRSGPITKLDDWSRPTRIEIGITAVVPYYTQFVYQLSHEIGHVMLNPRRSNGILEAIATAFSYEVLDRLSEKWKTSAPFDYVRVRAGELRKYRARAEQESLKHFPPEIRTAVAANDWSTVRAYLSAHASELDQLSESAVKSQSGRDWQSLAAMMLRSGGEWTKFVNLGNCTDPPPSIEPSLRYHSFAKDCAPTEIRGLGG